MMDPTILHPILTNIDRAGEKGISSWHSAKIFGVTEQKIRYQLIKALGEGFLQKRDNTHYILNSQRVLLSDGFAIAYPLQSKLPIIMMNEDVAKNTVIQKMAKEISTKFPNHPVSSQFSNQFLENVIKVKKK